MNWYSPFNEALIYGGDTPLEALLRLAISEGQQWSSDINGTEIVFSEDYFYTGVATEMHEVNGSVTVSKFSGMSMDAPDTSYVSPNITVP